MAESDDDPYVKLGREVLSGKTAAPAVAAPPPAADDPYVSEGRKALEQAFQQSGDIGGTRDTTATPANWTWRGLARNIASVPIDIGTNLLNLATDPSGNLVGAPLATALTAVHDFAAPYFGGQRFTPEERSNLLNEPQPGQKVTTALGKTVFGVDPNTVTGTPDELLARKMLASAGMSAYFAPFALGPALAGTVGAGAGDVAARAVTPYGNPLVPDWLKPSVELAGNIAGAKAADMATSGGTRVVNAALGQRTPLAESYARLGIEPLVGDVSGVSGLQTGQQYTAQAPGSQGRVRAAMDKSLGQFDNAVENTACRLGTSSTEQAAGDVLQREARNWRDTVLPAREAAAWQPLDNTMNAAGAVVDPSGYRGALSSLAAKLSALPETQRALLPAKTVQLLEAIDKDVPPGSTMSWQQARDLRTALGRVMGVPEIVQSLGKDQLKTAYGGISGDLRNAATAQDAARASAAAAGGMPPPTTSLARDFDVANKVSTEGHAFAENTLSKIIRANNPDQETVSPRAAVRAVLGSDDATLSAIRREMPVAANEAAAFALRDMKEAPPGQAGATGHETSISSFLTNLNKLRQGAPGGTAALFSDPAVAQRVQDLANVAASMRETARMANTSRTGPFQAIAQPAVTFGSALAAGVNPLYAAGAMALPFVANNMAGRFFTSPTAAAIAGAPGPRVQMSPMAAALLAQMEAQRTRNALTPPPNQ